MGGSVAGQSLKTLRNVESTRHHGILVAKRLQLRFAGNGRRQGDGGCGILRHQLGQLVHLPVRHLQHAPDVTEYSPRLQCAEGDDLCHLVTAIALLHVIDHFATAFLTEVDVEVRHRHALWIEKALEQQAKADRIEIGYGQCIGHQRARARAAAGSDRNALRLGPLDKVRDDQKIARIVHARDDIEFER